MENSRVRKIYDKLERNVLIMIAIPIPFFGFVYLNTENPIFFFEVPQLTGFWEYFGLGLVYTFLIAQYFSFQKDSKNIERSFNDLEKKLEAYSKASLNRFRILFVSGLVAAAGLFLFGNAGYTIAFAVTLVFFSAAKPTPERIIRVLKLKGEEKDLVMGLKRRE